MVKIRVKKGKIMQTPKVKKIPKELTAHQHTRVDNYYWLNDRENPEVIAYLNAENAYAKNALQHTEELQAELFEEITGKIVKDDASVPYKSNGYWYYVRYEEGKDYPIYCRKEELLERDEIVLLDVNLLAEGFAYYKVGGVSISPDNKMLCFGVDSVSRRIYTLYFKNLETGKILSETIENTTGSATWANDNQTVFYAQMEAETLRSYKIFRHELGVAEEVEVYHEKDDTFDVSVSKTKSKEYILIESFSTLSTEVQFLLADTPKEAFQIFTVRERDLEYDVEHYEDKFYIITNLEAKNFRIMETAISHTNKAYWQELIAHREDVLLEGFELFSEFLLLEEKRNGLNEICIIDTKSKVSHYLDFGEETYSAGTTSNVEFETHLLRFHYTSLTTPDSTLEYNMKTKEKKVLKETEVLGDFDKEDYYSERLWATAKDGVKSSHLFGLQKGASKRWYTSTVTVCLWLLWYLYRALF